MWERGGSQTASEMETPPPATMMPAAPTAAAVATPANHPIATMAHVAVRQRLDVQALHAKALEQLETNKHSRAIVWIIPDNMLWRL